MSYKEKTITTKTDDSDANRDPLTDAQGSHPIGTGIGALLGGLLQPRELARQLARLPVQ